MTANECICMCGSVSVAEWFGLRVKHFVKLELMTCTPISGDQKLWEGSHDGGLPDSCVFGPVIVLSETS